MSECAKAEVGRTYFLMTLPGPAPAVSWLGKPGNFRVVRDQRPLWVAGMSAAATGTSKGAQGDVAPKRKKGPGALATAYLVIYNVVMTAGYVACC